MSFIAVRNAAPASSLAVSEKLLPLLKDIENRNNKIIAVIKLSLSKDL